MRVLSALLLGLLVATPALAQLQQSYNTQDPNAGAAPVIINNNPPAVTTTTVNGQPVKPGTTAPVQSIGFDAKVKRDPNGNIISDGNTTMRQSEYHPMRNDQNMRNDRSLPPSQ